MIFFLRVDRYDSSDHVKYLRYINFKINKKYR